MGLVEGLKDNLLEVAVVLGRSKGDREAQERAASAAARAAATCGSKRAREDV
jgi:hypothetical protein